MTEVIDALLFKAGWWSAGAWLAFVITLIVMTIGLSRAGPIWSTVLALGGPFAAFIVIPVLRAVADPVPGCVSECTGRFVILAVSAAVLFGWAVALILVAAVYLARRGRAA
jgi:hypothetical protein